MSVLECNPLNRGILIFILALTFFAVNGQVVINELSSRNSNTINDFDKNYPDWIELLNTGNVPVNLLGWSLSDDVNQLDKWKFPNISLLPDSHLIVFCSGKDRNVIVEHWETIIHAENIWKYFTPFFEPDPAWKDLGFDDSNWQEGPGGFGRGDGDDNTVLPDSVATVYIRRTFNIIDTSLITTVLLQMDYDDAFVAYLNGVEIARSNIGWPGNFQSWNDFSRDVHPARMFQGLPPEDFSIDINFFKSNINEGENVLAIQALNAWNNHGNSSIIPFLSIGIRNDSFTYQQVPEWFGKNPVRFHTDFKLAGTGESLFLSNPNQNIIDNVDFPHIKSDHSYGRVIDGGTIWKFFGNPTPDKSNNLSIPFLGYTKEPEFNVESGFYSGGVEVSITNIEPGDTVRYSVDGSWISDTSEIFPDFILIDSTCVLLAQVHKRGYLPGNVASNSYLINFDTELPVVSISLNPHDLWDWEEGIYVMGPNASTSYPYKGANFWMDWKKSSHIEFFDKNQDLGFELDADIMIHGGFSRANPMKSLRILTDGKYDQSEINYQVFEDKDINKFNRLILRNSGQDYNITHFRDALMHKIVQQKTDIHIQDYEPAVVILNGEYWGIHNIREKIDRFYVSENFGIHEDSTEVLRENHIIIEGDFYHYVQMIDYIKNIPVVDSLVYDSISRLLNISNYTDYFIAEMYYVNSDGWPQHNTKYWRAANDTARWNYILTDTDFGFGLYSYPYKNELHRVLHSNIQWSQNHRAFRRLMENDSYKRYFINRSADMYNTVLLTSNIIQKIHLIKDRLSPEMERHLTRWESTYIAWEANVNDLLDFVEVRLGYVWQHYIDEFNLDTLVTIQLDVDSIIHGFVKINTIIPDSLPWQGIYFDGNPVDISAVPDSGYLFSHWQSNMVISDDDTLKQFLTVNVDTNDLFKAFFVIDTLELDTPLIVFNEINYRSVDTLDTDDWIELWNVDTISVDLSQWVFKDGKDNHEFILPSQTVLDTNEYLVLCQDTTKFFTFHPEIDNVIGPFEFGLDNDGEELRLFNNSGDLMISMVYSNMLPWPDNADGTGRTIELINPFLDLSDGTNWFAGCVGGSPGGPFIECDTVGINDIVYNSSEIKIYPNPFDKITTIEFSISSPQMVQVMVYDTFGNMVLVKRDNYTTIGKNQFILNCNHMNSGVYFLKLKLAQKTFTAKLFIR